jgi:hypothetical protein
MAVEVAGQAWTRKHDDPGFPVVASAPRTVYPRSLEELIEVCATRTPAEKLHAAGSHWALSGAAISDDVFIETHDPNNNHQAMGRTLYDVVGGPGCLDQRFIDRLRLGGDVLPFDGKPENVSNPGNEGIYPVHVEAGKRIYQLYAELDEGDDDLRSLAVHLAGAGNATYLGPWAFRTLGGAGGQTVFGALTTGTHGGDFLDGQPPIADSVLAMHLVADGGKHYWIEPETMSLGVPLTDPHLVADLYGQPRYGGPTRRADNFEFIRNDDLFDAVLISAGRFGIVYSFVIAAVRQYSLHHERRLTTWQEIKGQIGDQTSALYTAKAQTPPVPSPNKYLNVIVSVTPCENLTKHLASVTKAWNVPCAVVPGTVEPAGRLERRGARGAFDSQIQARRFDLAGNSSPYSPDPSNPGLTLAPDSLGLACTHGDFLVGVVDLLRKEIDDFVTTNGANVGPTIAAVVARTGVANAATALAVLVAALLAILPILAAAILLVAALPRPLRLGHVMNLLQQALVNPATPPGSPERMGGIFAWQMLAHEVFSSRQKAIDAEAISYAAMDGKDYLEQSCSANADSIEVFFDATDPMLIAYVDAILAYEVGQENAPVPHAFVGYLSLRFTGPTRGLLGQQRFPLTCAVEISGLRDVAGTTALIDFATMMALDGSFDGILHWGQRNESTRAQVQERFGDTAAEPTGPLRRWRDALGRITEHGRLDGFSNAFTRQCGLEICTPEIGTVTASGSTRSEPIVVEWDCGRNPSATEIELRVLDPSGLETSSGGLPLVGQRQVMATERGAHTLSIVAAIDLGGERRETIRQTSVVIA